MPKIRIEFKDPDALWDIQVARHPGDEDDPKVSQAREKFRREYTEYGDYGVIEIDPATLKAELVKLR